MEFKGTKGKWDLVKYASRENVFLSGENQMYYISVIITGDREEEEALANALLISKAPQLLEMLKDFLRVSEDGFIKELVGKDNGFELWEMELKSLIEKSKILIKEATELNN